MDPKKLSTLDPKLRETYEKIMGTSSEPVNQTPQAPISTPLQTPPQSNPTPVAQQPTTGLSPITTKPAMPSQGPQVTQSLVTPPNNLQQDTKRLINQPISGFMQNPTPKEELPPLPPLMQTQTVQDSPLLDNLKLNQNQEDFTKSPFATSSNNTTYVNPNPKPEEVLSPSSSVINQPNPEKKKNKLLPIILTVGAIVFFVVYTIVWAKLFNLF